MEQHNDERHISHQPSKSNLVRAALDPPTSLCMKLFTAIDEWRDHDAQEDLYTRLGAHDGTPPLSSHLATFNLLLFSLLVIQKGSGAN
ncbi:hypothetical protein [Absidia glauca]|uniref:Ndc10 domain-containing protein n=1 Tax=Absidia glauca TaxID=4829 RepID=A0A168R493_ABSGL|nr:hypothetical protein [Absidia glauca]